MPRLEELSEVARQAHLNFPAFEHDDSPYVAFKKPLSESKIALVTPAGLHVRGDKPFQGGDQSYRVIPSNTKFEDILQSHVSIGFDRSAYMRDPNVTFPFDRLKEMVDRGEIGSVPDKFYSFMGAGRSPRQIEMETGPEVGRLLAQEKVDAVLLTPT